MYSERPSSQNVVNLGSNSVTLIKNRRDKATMTTAHKNKLTSNQSESETEKHQERCAVHPLQTIWTDTFEDFLDMNPGKV